MKQWNKRMRVESSWKWKNRNMVELFMDPDHKAVWKDFSFHNQTPNWEQCNRIGKKNIESLGEWEIFCLSEFVVTEEKGREEGKMEGIRKTEWNKDEKKTERKNLCSLSLFPLFSFLHTLFPLYLSLYWILGFRLFQSITFFSPSVLLSRINS